MDGRRLPAFGFSAWHAVAAALNRGLWARAGEIWTLSRPPGCTTASGNSGTPWDRMHLANCSMRPARSAGDPVPPAAGAAAVVVGDPRLATRGDEPPPQAATVKAKTTA